MPMFNRTYIFSGSMFHCSILNSLGKLLSQTHPNKGNTNEPHWGWHTNPAFAANSPSHCFLSNISSSKTGVIQMKQTFSTEIPQTYQQHLCIKFDPPPKSGNLTHMDLCIHKHIYILCIYIYSHMWLIFMVHIYIYMVHVVSNVIHDPSKNLPPPHRV